MAKASVRNREIHTTTSSIYFEENGVECELETQVHPVDKYGPTLIARVGDKMVFGYLVPDDDPSSPDDWDGEGKIILLSRRHSGSSEMGEALAALGLDDDGQPNIEGIREDCLAEWIAADPARHLEVARIARDYQKDDWEYDDDDCLLSDYTGEGCADILWNEFRDADWPNSEPIYKQWYKFALEEWQRRCAAGTIGVKYAQVCDVYEHGGIHVSLSNTRGYPDEQWDVARGGAVWVPDQCAIDNIDWPEYVAKDTPKEHAQRARDYAEGCINTWNTYWSGDVYGHVVEVHEFSEDGEYGDGTLVNEHSCWDHYGHDYAKEYLEQEFNATVEHQSEEAV